MFIPVLGQIFTVSVIVGFAIPLINILTGAFGSLFNFGADAGVDLDVDFDVDVDIDLDVDIDAGGMDTGGADAGGAGAGIPFNFLCFCFFLIVFGVFGNVFMRLMTSPLLTVLLTGAALIIGAAAYWLMFKLVIVRLKKSTVPTLSYDGLPGKSAEVTMKISGSSLGMITVLDSTGAYISFRAKRDPHLAQVMAEEIDKGRRVTITEVDKAEKLCYVSTSPTEFTARRQA